MTFIVTVSAIHAL